MPDFDLRFVKKKRQFKIINKMGANVKFVNKRNVCGEQLADICVNSQKRLKSINCPKKFNSGAIDEFLIIFLFSK